MKQVVVHAPYDVRLDDVPSPAQSLGDHELLVRAEVSAMSPGTETRVYTGLDAERFRYRVSYPFLLGYNNVGRVVAVGRGVETYQVGQRIFSRMPHQSEYVAAERAHGDAGTPPSTNVPMSYDVIAPVPPSVPSDHAVFTHLLTLGFNALHSGHYRFGENVVVIGLGIVGLGAVCMAALAGARVAAIGNDPSRLAVARALGADDAWMNGDNDEDRARDFGGEAGTDLIIVCADAWQALRTAIAMTRRKTRVAVLAFPGVGQGSAPFNVFEPSDFYNRTLSYISAGWMPSDDYPPEYQRFTVKRIYRYILDRMASGRIDLSSLPVQRLPITRIKEAFELVLRKDRSTVGIVFDWSVET
ncbi:MAG: zinc-binding dehydrogenase [Armatimonadota bacterium]